MSPGHQSTHRGPGLRSLEAFVDFKVGGDLLEGPGTLHFNQLYDTTVLKNIPDRLRLLCKDDRRIAELWKSACLTIFHFRSHSLTCAGKNIVVRSTAFY